MRPRGREAVTTIGLTSVPIMLVEPQPEFVLFEDLHHAGGVRVSVSHCAPGSEHPSGDEAATDNSVVFIRRGAFVKRVRGERFTADANHVVFFARSETYNISHLDAAGDDCTILRIADDDLFDAARAHDVRAEDPSAPVRFSHGPTDPATDLLQRRLHRALRESAQDENAVADAVFDLVDVGLRASARARDAAGTPPARPQTQRADRERVEAARTLMAQRFREKVTLGELARAAQCSAYHLSRVFKRETGQTAQSYLSSLRVRAAVDGLLESRDDLGRIAIRAGFYDHSHFTNAFSRMFGFAPSTLRRDPGRTLLDDLRSIDLPRN